MEQKPKMSEINNILGFMKFNIYRDFYSIDKLNLQTNMILQSLTVTLFPDKNTIFLMKI
jgi:hypothetical protein